MGKAYSQTAAHPQQVAYAEAFLLPVIAWRVFRLRSATRPVRDGILLGLLIVLLVLFLPKGLSSLRRSRA